jgi:diguanylate cyclase (GGDEF)-like protein
MLFQALITYGSVVWGGSTALLADNSVDILGRSTESKKVMLENKMIQQWSNVREEKERIDEALSLLLAQKQIDIKSFMASSALKEELLSVVSQACLDMMRRTTATGSFIILANPNLTEEDNILSGVYFRDVDPIANPGNYSDVLIERGNSEFAHERAIPLDSFWTTDFHFAQSGEREGERFFYQPYQAALDNPLVPYQNLGYWSEPFVLSQNSQIDNFRVVTYSIPLVYEGVVYGVMGTEISYNHLIKMIVDSELENYENSNVMLAKVAEDGRLVPLLDSGALANSIAAVEGGVVMEATQYPSFYQIDGMIGQKKPLYVAIREFALYSPRTPFESEQWVLAGIEDYEGLFGFSDRLRMNLIIGIGAAFVFSCIMIYVLANFITKPIRKLVESIRASSGSQVISLRPSQIREVNMLYDVVKRLTEKQKENEYILREEKERYRIALRSSTDSLFSYDYHSQELEIIDENWNDGLTGNDSRRINNQNDTVTTKNYYLKNQLISEYSPIHPDFWQLVLDTIDKAYSEVELEILVQFNESIAYQWARIKGTVTIDTEGHRSKIIGSIKNIHQEKLADLKKLEEQRFDGTTGLLKKEAGRRLIDSELHNHENGCMVLLDMIGFRAINEEYGMVFGDAILEGVGRIIRSMLTEAMVGVRLGGDVFLIWISDGGPEDGEKLIDDVQERTGRLYPGSQLTIRMASGRSLLQGEHFSFEQLVTLAAQDLFRKLSQEGHSFTAAEVAKQQKEINDIVGITYMEIPDMTALAFNFFDRGGELGNIIAVMLDKLGHYYNADAIVVVMIDRDFRAVYLNYCWQRGDDEGGVPAWEELSQVGKARYFTVEEFEDLVERFGERTVSVSDLINLSPLQSQFLFLPDRSEGITIPMYDRERYIGSVSFLKRLGGTNAGTGENNGEIISESISIESGDRVPTWGEKDKNDLQEIVKIMESNISRVKHDLASQAKSDFLSRMSHEIRTPMNAIIGMTTIALMEKKDEARVEDCLHKISQSSYYLLGLINHILDMSKIESGKMKLTKTTINLSHLLNGVENMIIPQAESKNIHYRRQGAITAEWVIGDELRLSQVLVNLLGNAVKFTPSGGNISLEVVQEDGTEGVSWVSFAVQDDGIGISPENAERIFQSFEQVESSGLHEFAGTGLGLSISNHLVHMMGGGIELNSNKDQGSRFYFKLQMELTDPAEILTADVGVGDEFHSVGIRILLVEDNELNVEIAETILTAQGFMVEVALNGQEALDKYAASAPGYYDIILMDIRMPIMDGLEATKRIRKLSRADADVIPIIAMTANAFDEDMKKSIECGMNGHLSKPIDIRELREAIARVLSQP